MSDEFNVDEFCGIWADAFPDGISSTEIITCNRNGWEYEDYIRLRDMGVQPEDIAAIADRIAELEAQVARLQGAIRELDAVYSWEIDGEPWADETLEARVDALRQGDLDPITPVRADATAPSRE